MNKRTTIKLRQRSDIATDYQRLDCLHFTPFDIDISSRFFLLSPVECENAAMKSVTAKLSSPKPTYTSNARAHFNVLVGRCKKNFCSTFFLQCERISEVFIISKHTFIIGESHALYENVSTLQQLALQCLRGMVTEKT